MCQLGQGVSEDHASALEHYEKGAGLGDYGCYAAMALVYRLGAHPDNERKCWRRFFAHLGREVTLRGYRETDVTDVYQYLLGAVMGTGPSPEYEATIRKGQLELISEAKSRHEEARSSGVVSSCALDILNWLDPPQVRWFPPPSERWTLRGMCRDCQEWGYLEPSHCGQALTESTFDLVGESGEGEYVVATCQGCAARVTIAPTHYYPRAHGHEQEVPLVRLSARCLSCGRERSGPRQAQEPLQWTHRGMCPASGRWFYWLDDADHEARKGRAHNHPDDLPLVQVRKRQFCAECGSEIDESEPLQ